MRRLFSCFIAVSNHHMTWPREEEKKKDKTQKKKKKRKMVHIPAMNEWTSDKQKACLAFRRVANC